MYYTVPVVGKVHWIGVNDRRKRLFENMWPLDRGVSYNSYLIVDDKTALVDTIEDRAAGNYIERIEKLLNGRTLDYLIINHMEPDHSGEIKAIFDHFKGVKLVGNSKTFKMVEAYWGIKENLHVVDDGDMLDLGHHKLKFVMTPWVHWPETMLTWLPERRVLFTCDLFGSHLATSDVLAHGDPRILPAAKRYYAEIMMPFRGFIEKNLDRVTALDPAMIAPSHGPVYDAPGLILDAYRDWVSGPPKNLVLLPYISMHGSTRILVEHFVDACARRNVPVEQLNLVDADVGKLAVLMVDAATIVLGTPTVLGGPHPRVAYAALLANLLKPKARHLSVIGSLGWGGKAVEQLAAAVSSLKLELLPPVLCKGLPKPPDIEAVEALAQAIADKHAGL